MNAKESSSQRNYFRFGLQHKALKLLIAACIVSIIGLVVWPGCASVPLRPTKTPVSVLEPADFALIKANTFPRTEVLAKIGPPDEHFADLRVSAYNLNKLTRRRFWLLFGVLPFGYGYFERGTEVALIEFDETDHVRRIKIVRAYHPDTARMAAERFSKKPAKR
ncbi:MAG: hypothetical protein ACO1QS_14420 [Verrucomicrobiota bacterium]